MSSQTYPPLAKHFASICSKVKTLIIRQLRKQEIDILIQSCNQSSDPTWQNVMVMLENEEDAPDFSIISNCLFIERIIICFKGGVVSYGSELQLPSMIKLTTFKNSIIFPCCYLFQNTLIENSIILENSIIMGCGRICCKPNSSFGNNVFCNIGNETGGYRIRLDGDLHYNQLQTVIQNNRDLSCCEIIYDYSILGPNVLIENCSLLDSVLIGEYAHILASYMKNCSVLSSNAHPTLVAHGNAVDSILQWGVHFESGSNCSRSLLCEHSFTDCNAKIVNSIIAPNTGVSSGECNSSLVGPFIGFHHNSVLISAIWFSGKGNIGYGANVGSNHTGRLPDQECFPGEGMFFGLGCNIKYPLDFQNAPYSLIASGVTCLPQRVEMPFSLINKPSHTISHISPAYNEIFPGWALYDNYYMIIRNEDKFRRRNKSQRSTFETEVLREDIVKMLIKARSFLLMRSRMNKESFLDLDSFGTLRNNRANSFDFLRTIGETSDESDDAALELDEVEEKEFYTDIDIIGIGKNYITNKNRLHGIFIYSFFIRLFYLRVLKVKELILQMKDTTIDCLFQNPQWVQTKDMLFSECKENTLRGMMESLFSMESLLLQNAIRSKKKDFERGRKIVQTYDITHNFEIDMQVIEDRKQPLEEEKQRVFEILDIIDFADVKIINGSFDCS